MDITLRAEKKWWHWPWARREVAVPLLAMPLFLMMIRSMSVPLGTGRQLIVWTMAIVYAGLVLWRPMALPAKEPRPVTGARVRRAVVIVVAGVLLAIVLQMILAPGNGSQRKNGLLSILIFAGAGIAGLVAEGTLKVDLFPVWRRLSWSRVLYVVASALFLMTLVAMWDNVWGELAKRIGMTLGESPRVIDSFVSDARQYTPLALLIGHLISAAFEELAFRVGVLTLVWAITGRWRIGLLVSALLFGFYHIWPLNPAAAVNLATPVTVVLSSFGMGLANGLVYRYRGFTAAVAVHGLGNWLLLLLLSSV